MIHYYILLINIQGSSTSTELICLVEHTPAIIWSIVISKYIDNFVWMNIIESNNTFTECTMQGNDIIESHPIKYPTCIIGHDDLHAIN